MYINNNYLNLKCQVDDVIYKATVDSTEGHESYIGLASGDFKKRYYNHTKSFRSKDYINETEIAKYMWRLKQKQIDYNVKLSKTPILQSVTRANVTSALKKSARYSVRSPSIK